MNKVAIGAVAAACVLSGCATVNNASIEKNKSIELYRVFDIKTNADRYVVTEAASDGLGANVSSADESNPIVMGDVPEKPGRFKPVDGTAAFGNANGMMSLALKMNSSIGNALKTASCEGAVWTATAQKNADNAFNMSFNLCLWKYQGGYALDVYANYTKKEGGGFLGVTGLAREAAYAIAGTPEEWAEKTVLDVVRKIKQVSQAEIKYVEGYPKLNSAPWQDSGEVFNDEGYLSKAPVAPN
ncbi:MULTISPECIES: hypothetical protein [Alteromonas]|jgi:hypothetical protein|uniref:hypothetical protein n=1 Tax=Alteromonas TaxID=226 RepID=UPI000286F26D|nr:hypothetical protein [Alteromonas sp. W12]AFT76769.1 hypothetical protein AMBLS11_00875 [Alteromonas macleodii str. 'Black Sea 11']MEC8373806.1 hypothetical protein [Pseudomonadota bacterium]NKW88889.1 hypothetical protein [Alteromonadaceae bacterium A_SAG4]NKX06056.1 hypothetical protein [Alteromonadaceae bacterium A_SAG6]NKX19441.1 hypothetical protein [Alteromonadaceae bacterium A_SAG8]NKX32989.1 hypothetical protein [Alteromonadaceae bacterium A_SAG3]NKX68617.1 hypothetical protein [A|tara:strand:- start:132 stop:857 length:726 start_codon:yes stop_codon:yes gene_type:complete